MRPDELMVGDIVRLRISHHAVRIESIFKDKHTDGYLCHHTFLHDGEKRYNYSLSMLEPVPLTEEILEKNGFVKMDGDHYRYFLAYDDNYYAGFESVNYYTGAGFCNVTKECSDGAQAQSKGVYKHVHQLQHALRLTGINKEITI